MLEAVVDRLVAAVDLCVHQARFDRRGGAEGQKAAERGQVEVVRPVEAVCDVSAGELVEPLDRTR